MKLYLKSSTIFFIFILSFALQADALNFRKFLGARSFRYKLRASSFKVAKQARNYNFLQTGALAVATGAAATYILEPIIAPQIVPKLNSLLEPTEKLLAEGKYQEAVWLLEETGSMEEAKELKEFLEEYLSSGNFKAHKKNLGGATDKTLLVFDNGIQAIFKADSWKLSDPISWFYGNNNLADAKSEIAAYKMDQLLGTNLVPLTIPFTLHGIPGSLQYFVKDTSSGGSTWLYTFRTLKLFDYVIGNMDRHGNNWLSSNNSLRLVAIDHGLSFRVYLEYLNNYPPSYINSTTGKLVWSNPVFIGEKLFFVEKSIYIWKVDRKILKRIQKLSDTEIENALSGFADPIYIDRIKERVKIVQRLKIG
jgi:hypothetical protein